MNDRQHPAWWRGPRGEWYVVGQLALMALVFFGPRSGAFIPSWPGPFRPLFVALGMVMMIGGTSILMLALFRLRSNLTPLPHPVAGATLVQNGPYGIVRHPMYAGGIVLAYGWALFVQSWLTVLYATALMLFLDIKSRREER